MSKKNILKFIIPSLLGIFLFMIPLKLDGHYTILIKYLADILYYRLEGILPLACLIILFISAFLSVYALANPKFLEKHKSLEEMLAVSPARVAERCFGFLCVFITYFKIDNGFLYIFSDHNTGGFVLGHVLTVLFVVDTVASFLLPLLLDFGLLEYIGAAARKVMKPLFTLPGRAAIDCFTSWVGDGTLGVILTHHQYKDGHYSAREAAVIATTFSVVSIPISIVILSEVNLMEYFGLYYFTVCLAGIICAIIIPRIPPLSLKKDTYLIEGKKVNEDTPSDKTDHGYGLHLAVERAAKNKGIMPFIHHGVHNTLHMWLTVLPAISAIGTIALIISTYTGFFHSLGSPFIPFLEFLHVPEAGNVAETVVVGFASMFAPAILAEEILTLDVTKFIVAAVSVSQLIYMSETGALLLSLKMPVKLLELFVIFIERTIISLLVICPLALIFFA